MSGDGSVTLRDLNREAMALEFGLRGARHDVNRDGKVNFSDLLLIIEQLGARCRR